MVKRVITEKTNFGNGMMVGDRIIRNVEYNLKIYLFRVKIYDYTYVSTDLFTEEKPNKGMGFAKT